MKKILVFGVTENMGGVESFLLNYYAHFDRERIQLDFLCNTKEVAFEEKILELGGKVYRIPARRDGRGEYRQALKSFFEEHAGEYSAIWENVCSLANIDYLIFAKKYGIPCRIIHSHNSQNMDSRLRGILHSLNKRRIKCYATDYWACSPKAGEWFYPLELRKSEKYRQINNAIETEKFVYNKVIRDTKRKELGLEDSFLVGNVGRFHFQKNQLFLLEIFRKIAEREPQAHHILIGSGEDETKIRQKISDLELEEKVSLLGMRKDVPELLQAMDAFLFPSVFEGLPVVAVEAQMAGLPLFASKEGVPKETDITGLVSFISLQEPPEVWAGELLERTQEHNRRDMTEEVRRAGYDIAEEAYKLQTYFEEIKP